MKIKQMQMICDNAQPNHGCISCKLAIKEFDGCLKNHRYDVEELYKKYKAEKNEIMANKVVKDYQELERKYGIE